MSTNDWPKATTVDGVEIVPGLRVWDNNLDTGTVTDRTPYLDGPDNTPWFDVELDRGGIGMSDGSRLTTRWNGKPA